MGKEIEKLFGFKVGDKLYVVVKEKNKVYEFLTDCMDYMENGELLPNIVLNILINVLFLRRKKMQING